MWERTNPLFPSLLLQLMLLCHSIRRTGTENREERDTLRKWSGRKEGGKRYAEEVEWEERGRERDTLRKRRAKGKKEVEWEDETETGEPSQTHIVFTKNRKEGREEEP